MYNRASYGFVKFISYVFISVWNIDSNCMIVVKTEYSPKEYNV